MPKDRDRFSTVGDRDGKEEHTRNLIASTEIGNLRVLLLYTCTLREDSGGSIWAARGERESRRSVVVVYIDGSI